MAVAPDRPPMPVPGMKPPQFAEWYVTVMRWSIFPLAYMSKEPLFPSPHPKDRTCKGECGKLGHGVYDATNDLETVRRWWTDNPNANIGLAVPEGHIAVDVDAKKEGLETLRDLEREHAEFPRTLTNLTGSGGGSRHMIYTVPAGAYVRGTLGQGIQIKKHPGGYLVVPPSIHPETRKPYIWELDYGPGDPDGVPLAAPAWLLELLAQRNGHSDSNGDGIPFDPQAIVREGGRNNSIFTYAEFYHRKAVMDEPLRLMVHTYNQQMCEPPLDAAEVDSIITSAQRYDVDAQLMVARGNSHHPRGTLHQLNTAPHGQSNSHIPTVAANDNQNWKSELFKKPTKAIPSEHYPSEFNITHILRHDPKWRHEEGRTQNMMWYDVIRGRCMIDEEQVTDGLLINLAHWFGGEWRMQFNSTALLEKCVQAHCEANRRDLIQIWLNGLPPWDGTPRLDTWLIEIAAATDDDYTRHVSRRLPLSMVARAMVPGCQYREVVIFEGPQNVGKSHILQTLASRDWYIEMSMNLETKESHMMLQSAWLAELSELDSMNRTEKARLKAFITMETDTYVPKYKNGTVSYPRRSIMVGTTNDIEYLTDVTGNSRFLPVWTPGPITLEPLQAMREQLFAEALQAYREAGETWWHIPETIAEEAAFQQAERRVTSEWQAPLEAWLNIDRYTQTYYDGTEYDVKQQRDVQKRVVFDENRTSWEEIARCFLGIERREGWRDNRLTNPILNCLRALGWKRGKRIRKGGEGQISYWYRPGVEPPQDEPWGF